MSKLTKISLTQFKSFSYQEFSFPTRFIAITGQNGIGKTNLLDAIYYLCYTKSYFTYRELENVLYNSSGFRLEAEWIQNNQLIKSICKYDLNKKQWWMNDELLEKNNDYLGHFHAIMVAPDDINIINLGSNLRRKFVDALLAQENKEYLNHLLDYQKVLQQKGAYLKQTPSHQLQAAMLDVYDQQLTTHSAYIIQSRKLFSDDFPSLVQEIYEQLSGNAEQINIKYESIVDNLEDLDSYYFSQRSSDIFLKRTTKGIHNEDWDFLMNGNSVRRFSSQGQKKTFLFALKLAQWKWLAQKKLFPILLLDDLFEKIDQHRLENLFKLINQLEIKQIFFTHPNSKEIKELITQFDLEATLLKL